MMSKNRIELLKCDITKLEVDVIVNAANSGLMSGGGVDGAIHRAAGPQLYDECKEIIYLIDRCDTGKAVITSAGNMKAKKIIHTVGPIWHDGNSGEDKFLANAYLNSLQLALDNGLKTIAFPNISTGVYGFPKVRAAEIAIRLVRQFLNNHIEIELVVFACYDDENYNIYSEMLSQ